jgi:hypothetical protein
MALMGLLAATAITIPASAQAGTRSPGSVHVAGATVRPGVLTPVSLPGAMTTANPPNINNIVLYNTWTLQCADLPGHGIDGINTPADQYYCDDTSGDNQLWDIKFTRYAPDGTSLYEIVNVKSGLCLDPPGYGWDPAGTHLYTYYCNKVPANDNQEWWFGQLTNNVFTTNAYIIVNYKDGLCLDVSGYASKGSDLNTGLPLTLYDCYNAAWANGGWDDHVWEYRP